MYLLNTSKNEFDIFNEAFRRMSVSSLLGGRNSEQTDEEDLRKYNKLFVYNFLFSRH